MRSVAQLAVDYLILTHPVQQWPHFLENHAYQKDQNYEEEETSYIFEDGSAILLNSFNEFKVNNTYGTHIDNEQL